MENKNNEKWTLKTLSKPWQNQDIRPKFWEDPMEPIESNNDACCKIPTDSIACPRCGQKARTVGAVTLDHHLPPSLRSQFKESARFCPNPACEIVYFDGDNIVSKGETLFPVTQKDDGDNVSVCYCFHFKRADIRRDLIERGITDIPERIKQGISEGKCACERMNPQGACCLGNVVAAVQKIQKEVKNQA